MNNTKEIMNSSPSTKRLLNETKWVKSNPPNLTRILTHAKYQQLIKEKIYHVKRCGDKRCGTCIHLHETSEYKFKHCEESFKVKHSMTCFSQNIFYYISGL